MLILRFLVKIEFINLCLVEGLYIIPSEVTVIVGHNPPGHFPPPGHIPSGLPEDIIPMDIFPLG